MKNKFILSSLLVSVVALSISLTVLALQSNGINKVFGDGDNHDHEIHFFSGDLTEHQLVDGSAGWITSFTLSKENAIEVSSTEKYDIETLSYIDDDLFGTYFYGVESSYTYNTGSALIDISSAYYDSIQISFIISERATVNLSKSKVIVHNVTSDDYSLNTTFTDEGLYTSGYNLFQAVISVPYANNGDHIEITEVRLFFSC